MAWILESNRIPVEVEILKETRDFITIRTKGTEGAIRLRRSRIFETKEETLKSIKDSSINSSHRGPFGHYFHLKNCIFSAKTTYNFTYSFNF